MFGTVLNAINNSFKYVMFQLLTHHQCHCPFTSDSDFHPTPPHYQTHFEFLT